MAGSTAAAAAGGAAAAVAAAATAAAAPELTGARASRRAVAGTRDEPVSARHPGPLSGTLNTAG